MYHVNPPDIENRVKYTIIRTKTPAGALARRDWYISSPDGLEALRTPFLSL